MSLPRHESSQIQPDDKTMSWGGIIIVSQFGSRVGANLSPDDLFSASKVDANMVMQICGHCGQSVRAKDWPKHSRENCTGLNNWRRAHPSQKETCPPIAS